jgi:hypothetical protein
MMRVVLIVNNALLSKSACAAAKSKLLRIDHISILRSIDHLEPNPICSKQEIGICFALGCIGTMLALILPCTYKFTNDIALQWSCQTLKKNDAVKALSPRLSPFWWHA